MPRQKYEFTLVLSGIGELTQDVYDPLYEAGCDDASFGLRDGATYATFHREGPSFRAAVLSAIRDVHRAGVGARVEHVEPDELVNIAEIGRRLNMTREGVRKWVAGERGPGGFPSPAGGLTQRSPVWRWADVLDWLRASELRAGVEHLVPAAEIAQGVEIGVLNNALQLCRRCHDDIDQAVNLLRAIAGAGSS